MKNISDIYKSPEDEAQFARKIFYSIGELSVCKIENSPGISQTKASRYFTKPENAGITISRKKALWSYYFINANFEETRAALIACLNTGIRGVPEHLNNMARLVKASKISAKCHAVEKQKETRGQKDYFR